jgi:hypothetical protein
MEVSDDIDPPRPIGVKTESYQVEVKKTKHKQERGSGEKNSSLNFRFLVFGRADQQQKSTDKINQVPQVINLSSLISFEYKPTKKDSRKESNDGYYYRKAIYKLKYLVHHALFSVMLPMTTLEVRR